MQILNQEPAVHANPSGDIIGLPGMSMNRHTSSWKRPCTGILQSYKCIEGKYKGNKFDIQCSCNSVLKCTEINIRYDETAMPAVPH